MTDRVRRTQLNVSAAGKGERLDRFLAQGESGLSRSRLKALILAGEVTIDGTTIRDPGHRVNFGETIAVTIPPDEPAAPQGEEIPLAVVYEDDDVIVIDKPKGLVVHPAAGNRTGTLVNALIAHCGASLSGIGGVKRPGIVHRLDKDTTGLLVVAKNDRAHRSLAAQFADHGRTGPLEAQLSGPRLGRAGPPARARSTPRSAVTRARATGWRCGRTDGPPRPITRCWRPTRARTESRSQA